jgi:HK97 gp10 family phage protein
MVAVNVELMNLKELKQALRRLKPAVARKALRKAFRAGAHQMKEGVRDQIIMQELIDTGRMRDTLKVRSIGGRRDIGMIVQTGTREQLGIAPGDPYFYPAALEYGTPTIRPKQFMRRAFLMNAKAVENITRREVERELIAAERGR